MTVLVAGGYYMFIETSRGSPNMKAQLEGPVVISSGPKCLRFWYHMHGSTIGSLSVYVKTTNLKSPSWKKAGTQGNRWLSATLDISQKGQYTVRSSVQSYPATTYGLK